MSDSGASWWSYWKRHLHTEKFNIWFKLFWTLQLLNLSCSFLFLFLFDITCCFTCFLACNHYLSLYNVIFMRSFKWGLSKLLYSKKYGDPAFCWYAPRIWNMLPPHLRQATLVDSFMKPLTKKAYVIFSLSHVNWDISHVMLWFHMWT